MKKLKIIDTQVVVEGQDLLWVEKDSGNVVLVSVQFSKNGIESDRVIHYIDEDGWSNYMVRIDCSLLNNPSDSIIGIAEYNGKYLVQINNGTDIFQLKSK